ncbi:MAG TPA: hypothetical protein PK299_04535 [Anaerolineales bacterium]|nr:hypothetical protein [Anaerolineales bacterium]
MKIFTDLTHKLGSWFRAYQASFAVIFISLLIIIATLTWRGYDFRLFSTVRIGDRYDTHLNSWTIYQAIDNLLHRPFELGYAPIYFGDKNPFAYTIAPYGIAVFILPVFLITNGNIALSYNIYFLLTFCLTALGTHLLIRKFFSTSSWVSLFAAMLVAFAPFRFYHIGHIETLSTHFFVFGLYSYHQIVQEPRWKWRYSLGILGAFMLLSSGYLGIMLSLTCAVLFLTRLYFQKLEPKTIQVLFINLVVAGAIIAFFYAFRYGNRSFEKGYSLEGIIQFSATPLDWFDGASKIYANVTESFGERRIFIGYTPILLIAYFWINRKRIIEKEWERREIIYGYCILFFLGYLFTLGPVLKISESKQLLPLPYLILSKLPIFSNMRVPARFIWISIVSTGILSALALNYLFENRNRFVFGCFYGMLGILLTIEYWPEKILPIPNTNNFTYPPYVLNWFSNLSGVNPVFHYPPGIGQLLSYEYIDDLQILNQPMLNGFGSFSPDWWLSTNWSDFPNEKTISILQKRGIKYILIHHEFMNQEDEEKLQSQIQSYQNNNPIPLKLVAQSLPIEIYAVPQIPAQNAVIWQFDQNEINFTGWHSTEVTKDEITFQWMSDKNASLFFALDKNCDFDLSLKGAYWLKPETQASLEIFVNQHRLELDYDAGLFSWLGSFPSTMLNDNLTEIAFSIDKTVSPQALGLSKDTRQLGIAFDWLKLTCKN